jgi:hypothetical protein
MLRLLRSYTNVDPLLLRPGHSCPESAEPGPGAVADWTSAYFKSIRICRQLRCHHGEAFRWRAVRYSRRSAARQPLWSRWAYSHSPNSPETGFFTDDGLAYYSLMLPVGHTSKRFWPQGKRPASQGGLCRRGRNGSRCRRAYPISGLEAAVGPRVVIRPRRRSFLEFGWSRGHRGTRHFYVRNSRSSTTSRGAQLRSAVRQRQ